MPIINKGLSALQSDPIDTTLTDTNFNQRKVLFNGGSIFNFIDILSGVVDVKTKNYSSFYLTRKTTLDSNTEIDKISFQPSSILTRIKNGTNIVCVLSAPSNVDNLSVEYPLYLSEDTEFFQYFKINFIDDEYCNIQYDDSVGRNYITVSDQKCVIKRGLNLTDEDKKFRYIKSEDKLVLLKDIGGYTYQIRSYNNSLSAVVITNEPSSIFNFYFSVDTNLSINETSSYNSSYITYLPQTVFVDEVKSNYNLNNNYLLFRNLNNENLNKINTLVLKNQMNDLNTLSKSNNLCLSSELTISDLRTYTCISNDISQLEDEGMSLNYVFYNKSVSINPGLNYIKTEKSLFPFSQININDTKLAKSGAFASISPLYSDKIYRYDENNINEKYIYLCTWLSGAPNSANNTWVDRYYYPNLLTKQAAISSVALYSPTYDQYIEQVIFNNSNNIDTISDNLYFDKLSDLILVPDTNYIYERIDLDNLDFIDSNIAYNNEPGYYEKINDNNGFVLAFNIINQNDGIARTIYSKTNGIEGGLYISYDNFEISVGFQFYNTLTTLYDPYSFTLPINKGTDNNVVIGVDNILGMISIYINGELVINSRFTPLLYSTIIYGDFFVENTPLYNSQEYLTEVYLSPNPLDAERVRILSTKYNDSKDSLVISLPCGMRNQSDTINQISSLTTNLKSKTNAVNIYISDLGIDDKDLESEIIENIKLVTDSVLPINSNISNIEIL